MAKLMEDFIVKERRKRSSSLYERARKYLTLLALLVVSLYVSDVLGSDLIVPFFMRFATVSSAIILGLILVIVVDSVVFHEFNTAEEIKKGNTAVALFVVGLLAVVVTSMVFGF